MKVRARIMELIKEAGVPGVTSEIRESKTAGYYESPNTLFAEQLAETVEHVTGNKPIFKILTGGTDAISIKQYMGTPCLGYGSSIEGQAHVPDEKNTIDILMTSCKVYATFPYHYTG
jgi:acetylornithine deacetylase/succinyl-diaminopimelate desuccinylase-like protein